MAGGLTGRIKQCINPSVCPSSLFFNHQEDSFMCHLDLIFPSVPYICLLSVRTMCGLMSVLYILTILKLITHMTLQAAWLLVIFYSDLLGGEGRHLSKDGGWSCTSRHEQGLVFSVHLQLGLLCLEALLGMNHRIFISNRNLIIFTCGPIHMFIY